MRSHGRPSSIGQDGVDKAIRVWDRHVDLSVRRWIDDREPEALDFAGRVYDELVRYRRSELNRLNAPRDYGALQDIFGTRR